MSRSVAVRANSVNIVLVGEEGAGKHELIHAITHGELESLVTDFDENELEFELDGYKRKISLCCSGDEDRQNLLMLLRAHIIVYVYGVDSSESLGTIATTWVPKVKEYCPNTPTYLLGCKIDLEQEDPEDVKVSRKQAHELGKMIGTTAVGTCSAFKRINLLEFFVSAIRFAVEGLESGESSQNLAGTGTKKNCIVM